MKTPDLSNVAKNVQTFMVKRSPEILTGLGIAGMFTTVILAVKATPKALRNIDELERDGMVPVPKIEIVKSCWKCYIPASVMGLTSAACLIGATSVSARRTAALAAAYQISETALTEYREKVVETIGEKKEKLVREKISEDRVENQPVTKSEVFITNKGDTLFLEPLSRRYFKSDIELIRKAENKLNKEMLQGISGYVSLNEFYDEIGLEHTDLGDDLGWNVDKLIDIEFDPTITDDEKPCLAIHYMYPPRYKYNDMF
jgi:hypothetical protein